MKIKKVLTVMAISLLILIALLLILFGVLKVIGNGNNKKIDDLVNKGLEQVKAEYTVTQLDAGEYTDMRFYGIMNFHVDQYDIEELGNLSVMTADMGFMQMVSFMITPFEKNVPLCTLDFMYIMGNRKSYVEFYDLAADTQSEDYVELQGELMKMTSRWSDIEEIPSEPQWYDEYLKVVMHKQLDKDIDEERNLELFADALGTYLTETKQVEMNSAELQEQQTANIKLYTNGLIEKGGVSTDVFKKALGEEKTADFFDKVFFGTALSETSK